MSQVAPAAAPSTLACPRCQKPLIDPKGLGWCKACGYCRSLQESAKTTTPAPAQKPSELAGLKATGSAIAQSPTWIWIALGGAVLVAGATFGLSYLSFAPLERALLTTLQIGFGVLLLFVGQFIALLKIAPEDSTLSFKDAVFPFRLYGLIFKRLPATRLTVYLCTWALSAILSVNIFIGGLPHWLTYLPDSKKDTAKATQKKTAR